jgi:hypothetical protein
MQLLTIDAASRESANGFLMALAAFEPKLVEAEGRYQVKVALSGSDRDILRVLRALEDHVTERGGGPAKVQFDEHSYTLHPQDEAQ